MTIQQDLSIFSSWYLPFQKKMKHWKLDKIGYWEIGAGCLIEIGLELSPSPPNRSKDFRKMIPSCLDLSTKSPEFLIQKVYSKIHPVLCTNSHHDVTDLVNHGMVKNTKTWISRERNITLLWNKKISNLCLRWYILRSYRFAAEVTWGDDL